MTPSPSADRLTVAVLVCPETCPFQRGPVFADGRPWLAGLAVTAGIRDGTRGERRRTGSQANAGGDRRG